MVCCWEADRPSCHAGALDALSRARRTAFVDSGISAERFALLSHFFPEVPSQPLVFHSPLPVFDVAPPPPVFGAAVPPPDRQEDPPDHAALFAVEAAVVDAVAHLRQQPYR